MEQRNNSGRRFSGNRGSKFGGNSRGGHSNGPRRNGSGRSNDNRRGGFKRSDRDGQNRFERSRDGEGRSFEGRRHSDRDNQGYRGNSHRDFDRDNRRTNRRDDNRRGFEGRPDGRGDRSSFSNQRGNHQGRQSSANYDNPRKNSDGTLSFPSQNPYTARRPDEPKMPKGLEWSMLSKDEKERLRGLSKEHAENIGLHMLAAYALEEEDPDAAMEHAQWVARQASRVDVSRETLAFIAYRRGDYKLALREFRTAYRMNGYGDYLPFMADCERGLGNPQKAVDIALSDDAKQLQGESKAELFLVYAGALADLDLFDKAVEVAHTIAHAKGVGGAYRMRAIQAEQNFLELAGREDEARKLDTMLERLENQYADVDELDAEDTFIDNDLEVVDEQMLQDLGINPNVDGAYSRDTEDVVDAADESAAEAESEDSPETNQTDESADESEDEANTATEHEA